MSLLSHYCLLGLGNVLLLFFRTSLNWFINILSNDLDYGKCLAGPFLNHLLSSHKTRKSSEDRSRCCPLQGQLNKCPCHSRAQNNKSLENCSQGYPRFMWPFRKRMRVMRKIHLTNKKKKMMAKAKATRHRQRQAHKEIDMENYKSKKYFEFENFS